MNYKVNYIDYMQNGIDLTLTIEEMDEIISEVDKHNNLFI